MILGPLRAIVIALSGVGLWQAICHFSGAPAYILPPPAAVFAAIWTRHAELLAHAGVTAIEIALGLILGALLALSLAHAMTARPWTRLWLMPLSIASQAIPVFALAPILVLWLGYGLASKVAMTTLIVFFPLAAAAADGLRRTPPEMLDWARTMTRNDARARKRILWRLRWPMALPILAPGLKTAAAVSPIGAVIGEWVGASEGLGAAMLRANSRAETDMMFACALALMILAIGLYALTDAGLRWFAPWAAPQQERS